MYYCENCHLVCEGPVCPYCGSTSLRAPKGGDFCYLSTMVSPWGEAMQELLKEAGIRCLTRQARSVLYSVAFGQNHAELELFVPWGGSGAGGKPSEESSYQRAGGRSTAGFSGRTIITQSHRRGNPLRCDCACQKVLFDTRNPFSNFRKV